MLTEMPEASWSSELFLFCILFMSSALYNFYLQTNTMEIIQRALFVV